MRIGVRRSRMAILGTLLFVLIVILIRGRWHTPLDATLRRQPCTIAPGIHLLGQLVPAAAYVVDTGDGLVLIDTGQDPDCVSLRRQLRELQLDLQALRAIFLTHAHADHCMGARLLKRLTGATIHAGRRDATALRLAAPREAFTSFFDMPQVKLHRTVIDVVLDGEEDISFGDSRFRAIAAPGHSPGSMCYLLEKDGLRALFTGDVVLSLAETARFGGFGTKGTYYAPRYRASAEEFLATLTRLRNLPAPDLVLPGHPQLDETPQNARVTPAQWHAHLERGVRQMRTLVEHHRANGKIYLDGTAREILPGLHYFGDFQNSAVYGLATDAEVFLFDAPGGKGLADFVQRGMRQARFDLSRSRTVLLTSGEAHATAGLKDLVDALGCKVVVAKAGRSSLPELGAHARIVDLEDLPAWSRSFPGHEVRIKGRGKSPTAYQLRLNDKTVLVSGRILTRGSTAELNEIVRLFTQRHGNLTDWLWSIERLRPMRPDVWLPAVAEFGGNAFLCGDEWDEIIAFNEGLLRRAIATTNSKSR